MRRTSHLYRFIQRCSHYILHTFRFSTLTQGFSLGKEMEILFGFSQSAFTATILWLKPIAFCCYPRLKPWVNVGFAANLNAFNKLKVQSFKSS